MADKFSAPSGVWGPCLGGQFALHPTLSGIGKLSTADRLHVYARISDDLSTYFASQAGRYAHLIGELTTGRPGITPSTMGATAASPRTELAMSADRNTGDPEASGAAILMEQAFFDEPRPVQAAHAAAAELRTEARTSTRSGEDPDRTLQEQLASFSFGSGTPNETFDASRTMAGSPSSDAAQSEDEELDPAQLHERAGISLPYAEKIRDLSSKLGLTLEFRRTNPHAARQLAAGAMPKPAEIKAKSIEETDLHLGVGITAADLGLVGFFDPPSRPERPADMDDTTWQRVEQRRAQRAAEFADFGETMETLRPGFVVENNIVHHQTPDGRRQPVASDHDLFDIYTTADGTQLSPDSHERFINQLKAADVGIMHGALAYWQPDAEDDKSRQLLTSLVQNETEPSARVLRVDGGRYSLSPPAIRRSLPGGMSRRGSRIGDGDGPRLSEPDLVGLITAYQSRRRSSLEPSPSSGVPSDEPSAGKTVAEHPRTGSRGERDHQVAVEGRAIPLTADRSVPGPGSTPGPAGIESVTGQPDTAMAGPSRRSGPRPPALDLPPAGGAPDTDQQPPAAGQNSDSSAAHPAEAAGPSALAVPPLPAFDVPAPQSSALPMSPAALLLSRATTELEERERATVIGELVERLNRGELGSARMLVKRMARRVQTTQDPRERAEASRLHAEATSQLLNYVRMFQTDTAPDLTEIPQEINLVWLGRPMAPNAVANVMAWAKAGKEAGWRTTLWTDTASSPKGAGPVSTWHAATRDAMRAAGLVFREAREILPAKASGFLFRGRPAPIAPGLEKLRDIYDHARTNPRAFPVASDVLRYAILKLFGGVYLDVDIAPGRVSLTRPPARVGRTDVAFLAPIIRDRQQLDRSRREIAETEGRTPDDVTVEDVAWHRLGEAEYGNNFIVVPPRSTFIDALIAAIPDYVAQMTGDVLEGNGAILTGPGALARALAAHIGSFGLGETDQHEEAALLEPGEVMRWVGADWITDESDHQDYETSLLGTVRSVDTVPSGAGAPAPAPAPHLSASRTEPPAAEHGQERPVPARLDASRTPSGQTGPRQHTPLDVDQLTVMASALRSDASTSAGGGTVAACLALLRTFVGTLFPASGFDLPGSYAGVRAAGELSTAERWTDGSRWRRVDDWDTLVRDVGADPRARAVLVLHQRLDRQGHAFALYKTADGVVRRIEIQRGLGGPVLDGAPLTQSERANLTHAVVLSDDGRPLDDFIATTVQSASLAQSLIDAPTHKEYGAIGIEIEDRYPLQVVPGSEPDEFDGITLAERGNFRLVNDNAFLYRTNDQVYHADPISAQQYAQQHRMGPPEQVNAVIAEIVVPPIGVLRSDASSPSWRAATGIINEIRTAFGRVNQEGRPVPLRRVLEGTQWDITPEGRDVLVLRGAASNQPAYTQFTVGVHARSQLVLLSDAHERLTRGDMQHLSDAAEYFGRQIAAVYVEAATGTSVGPEMIPFLAHLPGVTEVWGHAWLAFSNITALPHAALSSSATNSRKLPKNSATVVSRVHLSTILQHLSPPVQEFFEEQYAHIYGLLENSIRAVYDAYRNAFQGMGANRQVPAFAGLAQYQTSSGSHNAAQYAESALLPTSPLSISQYQSIGAGSMRPDPGRIPANSEPLMLYELRYYGKRYMVGQDLTSTFNRLKEVSRAAAESAAASHGLEWPSRSRFHAHVSAISNSPAVAAMQQLLHAAGQRVVPRDAGMVAGPALPMHDRTRLAADIGAALWSGGQLSDHLKHRITETANAVSAVYRRVEAPPEFRRSARSGVTQALNFLHASQQGVPAQHQHAGPSRGTHFAPPVAPGAERDSPRTSQGQVDWFPSATASGSGSRDDAQEATWQLAESLVTLPEGVSQPVTVRAALVRQLVRVLHNPVVAARIADADVNVVVIPRDVPLARLPGLPERLRHHLEELPDDPRGMTDQETRTVFVAEENLLGQRAATPANGPAPSQHEGYSSALHELGHMVMLFGLNDEDRAAITQAYLDHHVRSDGPDGADGSAGPTGTSEAGLGYAATSADEYFAETVTAYLGANVGRDPLTGRLRDNGASWVLDSEPVLGQRLREWFGRGAEAEDEGLQYNPVSGTAAEDLRLASAADLQHLADAATGPEREGMDAATTSDAGHLAGPGPSTGRAHGQASSKRPPEVAGYADRAGHERLVGIDLAALEGIGLPTVWDSARAAQDDWSVALDRTTELSGPLPDASVDSAPETSRLPSRAEDSDTWVIPGIYQAGDEVTIELDELLHAELHPALETSLPGSRKGIDRARGLMTRQLRRWNTEAGQKWRFTAVLMNTRNVELHRALSLAQELANTFQQGFYTTFEEGVSIQICPDGQEEAF